MSYRCHKLNDGLFYSIASMIFYNAFNINLNLAFFYLIFVCVQGIPLNNTTSLKSVQPPQPYGRVIIIKNKVLFKDKFLNNDPFEEIYSLNKKLTRNEIISTPMMPINITKSIFSSSMLNNTTSTSNIVSLHSGDVNSVLGPLANHYQVITICNTLPSILKCQNRQHFLILHKIIYGISDSSKQANCDLNAKCIQSDEKDEFNCTGSNVCVIYPTDRYLKVCDFLKSNVTQIHLTCVKLGHLKNYFKQKYGKLDMKLIESKIKFKTTHVYNSYATSSTRSILFLNDPFYISSYNLTNASNSSSNRLKPPIILEQYNSVHNSIILISLITFSSFVAVILISLIYYRMKIRELLTATSLGIIHPHKEINTKVDNFKKSGLPDSLKNDSNLSSTSTSKLPPPLLGFEGSKETKTNLNRQPAVDKKISEDKKYFPFRLSLSYLTNNLNNLKKNFVKNYSNVKTELINYIFNTKLNITDKLENSSTISNKNLNKSSELLNNNNSKIVLNPMELTKDRINTHGICLDNNFYLTSMNIKAESNEYCNNNNEKDEENYSLSSKWMRRTLKTNVATEGEKNTKKLEETKEINAYKLFADISTSSVSSNYCQIINTSKSLPTENILNPKKKSPILKNKETKSKIEPTPISNTISKDEKLSDSKTKHSLVATKITKSILSSQNESISAAYLSSISGSTSASSSSSVSSESQCYYPRSSTNAFNFSHMLYDIPEEDSDSDEVTENDASQITDGILKI